MTTLYRPVLIESAEQAEALPVGTVLTRGWPHQPTLVTEYDGRRQYGAPGRPVKAEGTVGWTALVPIEAEEETTEAGGVSLLHGSTRTWPARTRLITPWEEQS